MIAILKISRFKIQFIKHSSFQNSHVSLKAFTCFQHYPEINMLGEISKHSKFMETHVRNHVNFQNSFDFSQHVKAKCPRCSPNVHDKP